MTDDRRPVRRRSPLGVSGLLLFACLFLPTLRVCGNPMMPVQFPPTYGVYIGGLLIGILGFSVLRHTRRNVFYALVTIYIMTAGVFLSLWIGAVTKEIAGVIVGGISLCTLVVAMRAITRMAWTERAPAVMCVVHALVSMGWSALLAFDPDGMWGAMVSLGAASLMLFASIGYLLGVSADERADEPGLPSARVV